MRPSIANHQGVKVMSCLVCGKKTEGRENSSGTDLESVDVHREELLTPEWRRLAAPEGRMGSPDGNGF